MAGQLLIPTFIVLVSLQICHSTHIDNKDDTQDKIIRLLLQELQQLKQGQAEMKNTIARHETEIDEYKRKFEKLSSQYNEVKMEEESLVSTDMRKLLSSSSKEEGANWDSLETVQRPANKSDFSESKSNKAADSKFVRNKRYAPTQVAFYADLSSTLGGLGKLHTIIYDHVKTNIGNAYNKNDGIFTAPFSGVYVFSWYCMADISHSEELDIVVDGQYFARSYTESHGYESASKTVVIDLDKGSEVWIRTSQNSHGHLGGNNYNSFAGWLLYPKD